jgi:hypothetical protein
MKKSRILRYRATENLVAESQRSTPLISKPTPLGMILSTFNQLLSSQPILERELKQQYKNICLQNTFMLIFQVAQRILANNFAHYFIL